MRKIFQLSGRGNGHRQVHVETWPCCLCFVSHQSKNNVITRHEEFLAKILKPDIQETEIYFKFYKRLVRRNVFKVTLV